MTIHSHAAAEIARVSLDLQQRIRRSETLTRSVTDNLTCAEQFQESCRKAIKRLDLTQAAMDAEASEHHRQIAHRLLTEIRKLNTEIDLERRLQRFQQHQQNDPRSSHAQCSSKRPGF